MSDEIKVRDLVDIINGWNGAGEREDRGRPNSALVLIVFDDGSGSLGTKRGDSIEDMNEHLSFDTIEELEAYLGDQIK